MDRTFFHGIYVPLVSPLLPNGDLDEGRFCASAERILAAGCQGLYLCGGTGDSGKLTPEERERITELATPIANRCKAGVMVHVGATGLKSAQKLAVHAQKIGAHALASVPPVNQARPENRQWYEELGAVSDLPLFIYHIPAVTIRHAGFEELQDLLSLPKVAGIKMTDYNAFLLGRIRRAMPEAVLYSGCDEQILYGMMSGADGVIGTWANLMPKLFLAVWKLVSQGSLNEAQELYGDFTRFLDMAWAHGVIDSFESLMRELDYAQASFRAPNGWTPDSVPLSAVRRMISVIEEIELKAGKVSGISG